MVRNESLSTHCLILSSSSSKFKFLNEKLSKNIRFRILQDSKCNMTRMTPRNPSKDCITSEIILPVEKVCLLIGPHYLSRSLTSLCLLTVRSNLVLIRYSIFSYDWKISSIGFLFSHFIIDCFVHRPSIF